MYSDSVLSFVVSVTKNHVCLFKGNFDIMKKVDSLELHINRPISV